MQCRHKNFFRGFNTLIMRIKSNMINCTKYHYFYQWWNLIFFRRIFKITYWYKSKSQQRLIFIGNQEFSRRISDKKSFSACNFAVFSRNGSCATKRKSSWWMRLALIAANTFPLAAIGTRDDRKSGAFNKVTLTNSLFHKFIQHGVKSFQCRF